MVEIYDENGLREIAADGNYRLMSDIELTAPWTPVSGFAGTLDGNGHVISGLQISGAGFFFSTEKGAVIQNLGLEGTVNHPATARPAHWWGGQTAQRPSPAVIRMWR